MNRRKIMHAAVLSISAIAQGTSTGWAQQANELIGSWSLVSVQSDASGKKVDIFGPNPKGFFMFDGSRFSIIIARDGLPKIASNNRMTATADENKSIIQGSLAYFGRYQATETGEMVQMVEGGTFANYMTADQKRSFKVDGGKLVIRNTASSVGAALTLTLVRAK